MTKNKDLNYIEKYLKTPQTETKIVVKTEDLYPDLKKSKLSPAARAKVVNRSGSNYISESQESYGPCSYSGCPHSTPFDLNIDIQGCK